MFLPVKTNPSCSFACVFSLSSGSKHTFCPTAATPLPMFAAATFQGLDGGSLFYTAVRTSPAPGVPLPTIYTPVPSHLSDLLSVGGCRYPLCRGCTPTTFGLNQDDASLNDGVVLTLADAESDPPVPDPLQMTSLWASAFDEDEQVDAAVANEPTFHNAHPLRSYRSTPWRKMEAILGAAANSGF